MTSDMPPLLRRFLLTLGFFTRLPLPGNLDHGLDEKAGLVSNAIFFPIIGMLIGAIAGIAFVIAAHFFPAMIAATFAIAAAIILTGALHEDGLADCADGLGATPDRERALEIMKDSRIGSYGVLALIVSFGLRVFALASLGAYAGLLALIVAHSASRTAILLAMRFSKYAKPKGVGQLASGELSQETLLIATGIALLLALLLAGFTGVIAVLVGLGVAFVFLRYLDRRLGGYTGDGLGAMEQIAQITILIFLTGTFL